jgi:hypothetical protein
MIGGVERIIYPREFLMPIITLTDAIGVVYKFDEGRYYYDDSKRILIRGKSRGSGVQISKGYDIDY